MTREILFRGKQVLEQVGKWREGFFTAMPNELYSTIMGLNEKGAMAFWLVDPETVGQFTGLLDKNGRKIFEGDIVKHSSGSIGKVEFFDNLTFDGDCSKHAGFYCKQWFDEYSSGSCVLTDYLGFDDVWVIGNIHENLELLNS